MKSDTSYIKLILTSWEPTFHKGQMTYWILVDIKESPKSLKVIQTFISYAIREIISYNEQSIYKGYKKYYDVELIDFELRVSERGPQRKYYRLIGLGKMVLNKFIERNIVIFRTESFSKILKKVRMKRITKYQFQYAATSIFLTTVFFLLLNTFVNNREWKSVIVLAPLWFKYVPEWIAQ